MMLHGTPAQGGLPQLLMAAFRGIVFGESFGFAASGMRFKKDWRDVCE